MAPKNKNREREPNRESAAPRSRESSPGAGSTTQSSRASVEEELHCEVPDSEAPPTAGGNLSPATRASMARSAMRNALPISLDTRPYFNDLLVERLNALTLYCNEETECYSLRMLPPERLEWGRGGTGRNDSSEYLCIDNKPVTVWIVGEIVAPNFAKDGVPRRKAGVLIRPLVEDDFRKAVLLANCKSFPKISDGTLHDGLWVTRWMGSRAVAEDEVPVFTEIYDASRAVRAKRLMTRKRHTEILMHDLAVAEAVIIRWPVTDKDRADQKGSRLSRVNWETWRVEYRLESLWYIYPGSDHAAGVRGPGEDVEI